MGYIDIHKLNLDELVGVVHLYPWFGGARKELCRRMSSMGTWEPSQFADAAMYVASRETLSEIMRSGRSEDYADADVEQLLRSYISEKEAQQENGGRRKVYAGAGDYFSQDEYDQVRSSDDNVFSRYAAKAR